MPPQDPKEIFIRSLTESQNRLYGYVYSLLGSHQAAAEVLQMTNLVLWRKLDEFRAGSDFIPWAICVVLSGFGASEGYQASPGAVCGCGPRGAAPCGSGGTGRRIRRDAGGAPALGRQTAPKQPGTGGGPLFPKARHPGHRGGNGTESLGSQGRAEE
ncbi:MAG: hypothetical protein H7A54_05920 [Akkermansiaceae bacterium]|nr:hypothetical protein [Verrucomicrobiae bacterium]MCP5553162.1 hypothetical protein [Akkermansiaceae bacterium]